MEGVGTCADCDLPLVSQLPDEGAEQTVTSWPTEEPWTVVGLFGSEWEASILRGALESEGIPCEIIPVPMLGSLFGRAGLIAQCEIMVPESVADRARELIRALEISEDL